MWSKPMKMAEYLTRGSELARIGIETYQIRFEFSTDTLAIGGEFTFKDGNNEVELFRPGKRSGAVQRLWSLIGATVDNFDWPDPIWETTMLVRFSSGGVITVPPASGPRGTIYHHHPTLHILDDF